MNDTMKHMVFGALLTLAGVAVGALVAVFAMTKDREPKLADGESGKAIITQQAGISSSPRPLLLASPNQFTQTPARAPTFSNLVIRPTSAANWPAPSAAIQKAQEKPEVRKAREEFMEAQKRYIETMKKAMEAQKAGGSIQPPAISIQPSAISGQPSAVSPPSGQPPRK